MNNDLMIHKKYDNNRILFLQLEGALRQMYLIDPSFSVYPALVHIEFAIHSSNFVSFKQVFVLLIITFQITHTFLFYLLLYRNDH